MAARCFAPAGTGMRFMNGLSPEGEAAPPSAGLVLIEKQEFMSHVFTGSQIFVYFILF